MADVLPQSSCMSAVVDRGHHSPASEMLYSQSSLYTPPEPNPSFRFPLQAAPADAVGPNERPVKVDAGHARRSMNRSRPQRLSINNTFEFCSTTTSSATTLSASPARSPINNTPSPGHSSGHRRNGSEFIGGDSRPGGPGLMSTSPTKGEGTLPTPTNPKAAAPRNRRGHAHRRSGAISSHDVSMILKPSSQQRGGSAPTTPCIPSSEPELPPEFTRAISQPVVTKSIQDSSTPGDSDEPIVAQGPPRPRVGFSDTIEFIPRPLSTISSETSSSLSTLRGCHSVTGSITSIISSNQSSPPSKKGMKSALDRPQPRPRTAGPTVSGSKRGSHFRDLSIQKRPSSASAVECPSSEVDNSQSMSAWKTLSSNEYPHFAARSDSDLLMKETERNQPPMGSEPLSSQGTHRLSMPSTISPLNRPKTSPESKVAKGQTRVKTWADSILSRRTRPQDTEGNPIIRASQISFCDFAPESDFCLEDINFDEDTTCVIQTPPAGDPQPSNAKPDISAWRSYETNPTVDSDATLSMLDLDAALDLSDSENTGAGGFSAARRRMHSSGATGGFSGPGMHYHRRADSAPEMVAVNYHTFGFPRLGSNPAMADVFEEEEEDTEHVEISKEIMSSHQGDLLNHDVIPGLGVEIIDVDCTNVMNTSINRKPRALVDEEPSFSSARQEPASNSLEYGFVPDEFGAVEIVNGDEEPRFSVITKSSDESTITPTLSHDALACRPASAPIDFATPKPVLFYTTPESSSCVSSPDFSKSSFDIPRMHTANSSLTDRATMSSSRTYEHGLGMHDSVDDVPSLISCASTAGSGQATRGSCTTNSKPASDHSPSLSGAVPTRPRYGNSSKRSSLASIKFFGGYHSERSKLNIEERAPADSAEKKEKKKGNRISRLMRFWKSKEKLSST